MSLKYRTIPRKHRTMLLKHRPYVGIMHRHQSPIRHLGHNQFGEMPFDNGPLEDDRSNFRHNRGHFRHKRRDLEEHSGHLELNHVHFRHNRDLDEHAGQLKHNLGHKYRDLEQHNGHLEHNNGHFQHNRDLDEDVGQLEHNLGHKHRDLKQHTGHVEHNRGHLGYTHRDLEEHSGNLEHNHVHFRHNRDLDEHSGQLEHNLGHKHRDLEQHNGHLEHNHGHLGHTHRYIEEHNGHLEDNQEHLGHKHRDLEEHNKHHLEHNHGRFRHKHINIEEHRGNFRRNHVTEQFGNKHVVVGHQTRWRGSPTEMLAPNGILYSPSPPEMVTHVPVDSNHYGRAGTPGGSRVVISSPMGRGSRTLSSPGSSVNYAYSTPLTPVHVPEFEGTNAMAALPENPSPSESNVTMDYDQWLQNDGYERGHGRIDHFPRAGRGSPDSMAYMHQAPNKKARARNTDNQEPPSNSCCIIS